MPPISNEIITQLYKQFNERNIDAILPLLAPDVDWPNGWEGGYVKGHDEVRSYWTRQWKEIDPVVTPTNITVLPDKRIEVQVKQLVKDKEGLVIADDTVLHIYTIHNNLIQRMEIQKA